MKRIRKFFKELISRYAARDCSICEGQGYFEHHPDKPACSFCMGEGRI